MATAGRASRSPLQAPGWLLQTCVLLRLVHMHRDTYKSAAEPTRFERGLPVTKGPMEANRVAASVGSEPRGRRAGRTGAERYLEPVCKAGSGRVT